MATEVKKLMTLTLWRKLMAGSLIFLLLNCQSFVGKALSDNIAVIEDIKGWKHPVKDVFKKYEVVLYKVELEKNQTYATFYVGFKYDPRFSHNDKYFNALYYETLKANGFWDYSFISRDFNCRINIKWDRKSKTLTENLEDLK
jgi:hypothetical protein